MQKIYYFLFCLIILVGCSNKQEGSAYELPDLNDIVIYQVNPRVFAPENSFKVIESRLDSIKTLGANILWFMPIYEIGVLKSKNSPYCVKNYKSINPEFGSMDDFKKLILKAHQKGIGVIVDWVPNHTSWDNEWIVNKEWYTQDSLKNIIYPEGTNWDDVADLNYDNTDMRLAMIEAMRYWVTTVGVDGFRCDAVDFVPADFLKQCNDSLRSIPNKKLLLLAEGSRKDHFESGFDLNYAWDFVNQMRKVYQENEAASTLFNVNENEYANISKGKLKLRFTTNHDEASKQSPITEWVNKSGSMSAFATIAFFPGCPMIYNSQEVGYPKAIDFFKYVPIDWLANLNMKNEYKRLIEIRSSNDVLKNGDLRSYPDENILLFERYNASEKCFIAINVRNSEQKITLPQNLAEKQYINLITGRNLSLGNQLTLQPFEYLIFK